MTQYFDGPGLPAAEHSKAYDTTKISRLERERNNLIQQIEDLQTQRHRMGEDLKRANTDVLQYKDRTQALQKQISGLKSGKYKPDQVPEFKTHNPNQQIIKALLSENEELNKRIELLKEIKEKVTTNAANKNQSELFDALTYLEEENKNLRSQLNLGETSQYSIIANEIESAEIAQLREKLRMSMDRSRDLSDQLDSMNKALHADRLSPQRPMVSKEISEMVSRTPVMIPSYPQQMPNQRPPAPIKEIPYVPYPTYESSSRPEYHPIYEANSNRPMYYNNPSIPPRIIMPPGPGPMRPQDDPRLPPTYKDHLGYN